jgi:hypothetical protein
VAANFQFAEPESKVETEPQGISNRNCRFGIIIKVANVHLVFWFGKLKICRHAASAIWLKTHE